jgi:hypothetical protein
VYSSQQCTALLSQKCASQLLPPICTSTTNTGALRNRSRKSSHTQTAAHVSKHSASENLIQQVSSAASHGLAVILLFSREHGPQFAAGRGDMCDLYDGHPQPLVPASPQSTYLMAVREDLGRMYMH